MDVSFLANKLCSTENIAIVIWERLVHQLPQNVYLHCIKLYETPKIMWSILGNKIVYNF